MGNRALRCLALASFGTLALADGTLQGVGTPQGAYAAPSFSPVPGSPLAPDSLATVFGDALAPAHARPAAPALRVAGVSLMLIDSRGVYHPAQLLSVSPSRVEFVVPGGLTPGTARLEIRRADGTVLVVPAEVRSVAPTLAPLDGNERGEFAARVRRVTGDGSLLETPYDQPLDLTQHDASVYLWLYASGVRGTFRPLGATVNGQAVQVRLARRPPAPGLDLLELGPLPRMNGRADAANLTLIADGTTSNTLPMALHTGILPGEWSRRAPLPAPNSELSVTALGGKLYVLGGYPASRISVRTVQVYDPTTDSWELTTPLPVALNHTVAATVGGRLYLIGGQEEAGGSGPFVDTVYAFDAATARWSPRARMPTARSGGAAAVIDGRIYVAGGRPPHGNDFAVYDPARDAWTVLPPLPTQRNHLAAAAVGGRLYVIGGRFGAGFESERTDRVEIFDPATNRWSAGAAMPRPRGGVNVAQAYGCLHVFGGEGDAGAPNGVFPDHDVYDPAFDRWTQLGTMPIPVHGVTGAVFANGLIYLPGGGTAIGGSSGSTLHQVYRPALRCRAPS